MKKLLILSFIVLLSFSTMGEARSVSPDIVSQEVFEMIDGSLKPAPIARPACGAVVEWTLVSIMGGMYWKCPNCDNLEPAE